jgi:hypothetical protein
MPVAAKVIGTQLIAHDEEDVLSHIQASQQSLSRIIKIEDIP